MLPLLRDLALRELWEMMFSLETVACQQLDVPNDAQHHLQDTVITFSFGSR